MFSRVLGGKSSKPPQRVGVSDQERVIWRGLSGIDQQQRLETGLLQAIHQPGHIQPWRPDLNPQDSKPANSAHCRRGQQGAVKEWLWVPKRQPGWTGKCTAMPVYIEQVGTHFRDAAQAPPSAH
jgi:hypothetical protein